MGCCDSIEEENIPKTNPSQDNISLLQTKLNKIQEIKQKTRKIIKRNHINYIIVKK